MSCLNCNSECIPISDQCIVVDGASLHSWYKRFIRDILCSHRKKQSCSVVSAVSVNSISTVVHPGFSSNYSKSIADLKKTKVSIFGNTFSDFFEISINTTGAENKQYNPEVAISIIGNNGYKYTSKESEPSFALTYDMIPVVINVSVLHYTENGVVELQGSHKINTSNFNGVTLNLNPVDKGYTKTGYSYNQYDFNKTSLNNLSKMLSGSFFNASEVDSKMNLLESMLPSTGNTNITYTYNGDKITKGVSDYYNDYLAALNSLEQKIVLLEQ
jgi:hypothetical protein